MNSSSFSRYLGQGTRLAPLTVATLCLFACSPKEKPAPSQPGASTTAANSSAGSVATQTKGTGTGGTEQGPGEDNNTGTTGANTSGATTSAASTATTAGTNTSGADTSTTGTDTAGTNTSGTNTAGSDQGSATDTTNSGDETSEPDTQGLLTLEWLNSGSPETFVSLAVRSTSDIWVSGSRSTLLHSSDAGKSWRLVQVSEDPADTNLQFRDIEIVRGDTIYLLAAGEGQDSRIFKTTDAGRSWREQYRPRNERAFINCMDFWDTQNGMVYGDSLSEEFFVLKTDSGGNRWRRIDTDRLPAIAGKKEGGFSSSGTCAIAHKDRSFLIGTGAGERPRVLYTEDRGNNWEVVDVPVVGGSEASGISSISMWSDDEGMAFGINLDKGATTVTKSAAYTQDGGKTWEARNFSLPAPGVYGSAANSDGSLLLVVSPAGLHYSQDKGLTWIQASTKNLWTVAFASDRVAYAAGKEGNLVKISVNDLQ